MPGPDRPRITPDSKVLPILEAYPEAEAALLRLSPAFEKLRNPVLRATVARLATLRQVAATAGVPISAVIRELQQATGLAAEALTEAAPGAAPAWAVREKVTRELDARELIDAGQHPLERVMNDLSTLGPGEVYALITPFVPGPLLDVARTRGFASHAKEESPGQVVSYFQKM